MSHKATAWLAELETEALTNGEFRVLFHLCDCHNPKFGCYPSQEFLRAKTGLSNGGLNKVLLGLEAKGLLAREQRNNAETKKRISSRYILGFELKPTPLSGDGANSTFDAEPTPLFDESQLHPSGDKPVIGTSNRTSKRGSCDPLSSADDAKAAAILEAFEAYNLAAAESGWPKAQTLSKPRKAGIAARLRECGGIEGWRIALSKAQASAHCCGQNQRGWVADLDFIIQAKSFTRLMEGAYDNRNPQPARTSRTAQMPAHGPDPALEQIARLAGLGQTSGYGRP